MFVEDLNSMGVEVEDAPLAPGRYRFSGTKWPSYPSPRLVSFHLPLISSFFLLSLLLHVIAEFILI